MNLKILRKNKHLTQEQISKELQISRVNYNRYEIGKVQPDIETLKKLADYYQTSLDYLCDFTPPYQLTLPPLSQDQKKAIQILINLPVEIFYYMFAKLEGYQEQYKIQIN